MFEDYEDPRYGSSQGRWVTYDADAGPVWEPITVGAPSGQYVTTNADAGGQWVDNSAAEQAAMNAQREAARQAEYQQAGAYAAANPLAISGNQINTQYAGYQNIANFFPLANPGEAITGSTRTQLIDPSTGAQVYLSDPNNPNSYTYDNTGTPALGGTLEEMAAIFKPIEDKGMFGTLGADLGSAAKDPLFHKFLISAAALAAPALMGVEVAGLAGAEIAPTLAPVVNPLAGDIAAMIAADQAALGGAGMLSAGEIAAASTAAAAPLAPVAPAAGGGLLTTAKTVGTVASAAGALANAAKDAAKDDGGWLNAAGNFVKDNSGLLSGAAKLAGGYLSGQQAKEAGETAANAQIEAAKIAAEAAKFRPVGVSTRFGASQFGYDANGNLNSAGYTLSPEMRAQQDRLMGVSNQALGQYEGAYGASAPMGQAAQSMMTLGQGYLSTSPQAQAQKYMDEQQALLAGGRATDYAAMQNRLQSTGRAGLSMGGGGGMTSANPEMQAYYNSLRQQDLGLAAQATQGGMDYAKYGAGMVGAGGQMLRDQYGTQTAAYNPYQTAMGGATMLEGLGQNSMDLGVNIGTKGAASGAITGQLLQKGYTGAASTMLDVNKVDPWGGLLTSAGQAIQQYAQPQQQPRFDPMTGQQIRWGS